ncbi:hypothetical protein HN011_004568 [Eciton burchellii]|nr:hypothetical protein HN011_004568 [Eciton burchellii]
MDSVNPKEDENAKTEAVQESEIEDSNSDSNSGGSNVSTRTSSEVNHLLEEFKTDDSEETDDAPETSEMNEASKANEMAEANKEDEEDEEDKRRLIELRDWCERNIDTECESPPNLPKKKVRRSLEAEARAIAKSQEDVLFEVGIEFDRSTPSTSTAHMAPIHFFDSYSQLPSCNLMSHFPIRRSKNVYELTHYLKNMIQSDEESPVEDFIEETPICIPHVCHIPGCDKWYDSNRALNRHIHLNHRKRYLPTPSVREQNIYCKRFKRICLNYNCITMSRAFATHPDFLVYATDKAKSAIRRNESQNICTEIGKIEILLEQWMLRKPTPIKARDNKSAVNIA